MNHKNVNNLTILGGGGSCLTNNCQLDLNSTSQDKGGF